MDMYCRTCYRANGARKFDISALSQVTDVRIGDMLIYCLQIEITPFDRLPQKICEACLCSLNSMFLFRKHCYFSDTELRKMLKYAPPEHLVAVPANAPDMEQELDLVDALKPTENDASKSLDLPADEPNSSTAIDQPSPQETLPPTEDPLKDLTDSPIVVEKYLSKLFECEQCDYRSSFKCNILRHQQCKDHTGYRVTIPSDHKPPLKGFKKLLCCGDCGFQTFVRSNFLRHQRVWKHSSSTTRDVEVKRVLEKCPTCPHCGVQRANLQAHMAQWCRVLRAKGSKKQPRRDTTATIGAKSASLSNDDEGQPIEMKIEIEDSSAMTD